MHLEQSNSYSINCNGHLVELSTPKIMGILNLTPDSFSDGGKFNNEKNALLHTEKMLSEGATFIDIGAQSTRPNAKFITAYEEIKRLKSIISNIKKEFPDALLSIDTFWSETLRFAVDEGIDLVNDISAGQFDNDFLKTVSRLNLPYILMHNNSSYDKMHTKIAYQNITHSVNDFLLRRSQKILEMGIKDIIWDPGFGFGKTIEDQYSLIEGIENLGFGKFPILIGISRKSFIYKPLGKSPLDIDEKTQELHLKVLRQGAKILRVHNVASAKMTINKFLE